MFGNRAHQSDSSVQSRLSQNKDSSQDEQTRSSGAGNTTSSIDSPGRIEREELVIAKDENRAVLRIRLGVLAFLTICTVGAAIAVYLLVKKAGQEALESALFDFASKVFSSMAVTTTKSLIAVDAYAVETVSYAQATNMTWPFVTVPNVAAKASKLLSATNGIYAALLPLVTADNREEWDRYSLEIGPKWVEENLRIQKNDPVFSGTHVQEYSVSPIWGMYPIEANQSEFWPSWQSYPTGSSSYTPFNFDFSPLLTSVDELRSGIAKITSVINAPPYGIDYALFFRDLVGEAFDVNEPISGVQYPLFEVAAGNVNIWPNITMGRANAVGILYVPFYWRGHLLNMLPAGVNGLILVVENSCNTMFTYEINGPNVKFLGYGDYHDTRYDQLVVASDMYGLLEHTVGAYAYTGLPLVEVECAYSFRVYPSKKFEAHYISSNIVIYTSVTVAIFIFTSAVFWFYDSLVERRQRKVMLTAVQSSAIVSSLFPSNVRARLYEMDGTTLHPVQSSQKNRLKSFIQHSSGTENGNKVSPGMEGIPYSKPIADLFPEATVMFADIVSFTAWSSTREPSQVFILLESLYGAFDSLASKRGVFKVETIGDCYVAVAGLPDPRPDHAVVMARFATDCCKQMTMLMGKLSMTLGPDTEDLTMRFGLNSGPVTAGVLRGQKSRFQLFGDTVNTAARMESTGAKNRIHVSQSTADELVRHKKRHWLHPRQDTLAIKGKGLMSTYWVNPREEYTVLDGRNGEECDLLDQEQLPDIRSDTSSQEISGERLKRLVGWNVEILSKLLHTLIVHRQEETTRRPRHSRTEPERIQWGLPIDEVEEILRLPDFNPNTSTTASDFVDLDPQVATQLHEYVTAIAATYHLSNPFHNFAHASHVCMSVSKLMSRIVAADGVTEQPDGASFESLKFQQTFGIASDPLTLFACAFAALIHDADHPGVPNAQLVKEGTDLAIVYRNRSIAEQRSVDVAWNLLMEERFGAFRESICQTEVELRRFRQLVVNCVMATDIMDKELKQLRNDRWDKAFSRPSGVEVGPTSDEVNRKATIVLEHLIQASDVAHTMQHWHIFRKWNECLFMEMFQAYEAGRSEHHPAEFWYKGELGFFDFYVIPLAKKLSECGVFGVSSDEYLNYALKNREEWELKGESLVAEMVSNLKASLPESRGGSASQFQVSAGELN